MKVALVYGTAAPAGRLFQALSAFSERIAAKAEVKLVDLSQVALPGAGSVYPDRYPAQTVEAIDALAAANAVMVFTPIYRAAAPGALKNFLDLVPVEALESKPVGIVAMGATDHHFLAAEVDLHPVLAWFGAFLLPTSLYLTSKSFAEGNLTSAAEADLDAYGASFLDIARRLAGLEMRPRPLAARGKG